MARPATSSSARPLRLAGRSRVEGFGGTPVEIDARNFY
jgi:hypothetical protein